jgi:hypothetical protein
MKRTNLSIGVFQSHVFVERKKPAPWFFYCLLPQMETWRNTYDRFVLIHVRKFVHMSPCVVMVWDHTHIINWYVLITNI